MLNGLTDEIELMQKLDHPNIVKYYDVVKTATHWYIIMEYCNSGTLTDVVTYHKNMCRKQNLHFNREANTYYYMKQLVDALNYIKSIGYIHRDIKPQNILLTKPNSSGFVKCLNYYYTEEIVLKLADFGLAKQNADNDLMNTICGSPLYMAPELLLDTKAYNSKIDLWSCGVVLYELMFGEHPNHAFSIGQIKENLKNKKINFQTHKNFSMQFFDLLKNLLEKDSGKRIDWDTFFNHQWFNYWKNIMDKNLEESLVHPKRICLKTPLLSMIIYHLVCQAVHHLQ